MNEIVAIDADGHVLERESGFVFSHPAIIADGNISVGRNARCLVARSISVKRIYGVSLVKHWSSEFFSRLGHHVTFLVILCHL